MTVAEAEAELALLRAARLRLISGGIASYAIAGRSVQYLSLADLNARENVLLSVINGAGNRIGLARFRSP